jgi:poly-gamma-glutamate system protein
LRYRPGRVHSLSLVALAVVGLGLLAVVERSRTPVMQPHFAIKMDAARRARLAIDVLREARFGEGGPIDVVNDPNETGLVGHEFSLITTSRGSHDQKLRALDPNIAAVFVHLLKSARVGEGDLVAVAMTGAYPLLDADAIIAVEAVGAVPVPITSVGASMWGANDPDFTWLDMERVLAESGIVSHRSVAASRGGGDDMGRGLSPEGRALVDAAIERNGIPEILESTLDASIERRMEIYAAQAGGERYKVYLNVGAGLASIGSEQVGKLVRPGLTRRIEPRNFPRRGAMIRMANRGAAIIHVPNADALIERYGLAPEPVPLPEVGVGAIFYRERYNVPLAGVLAALYGLLVFAVVRLDLKHYLFRRASPGPERRVPE